jgi:hypothetical protein
MARCVFVFVLLASLSVPPAHASAPCPESCTTTGAATVCTLAAARDSSILASCPIGPDHGSRAAFDLVMGTTLASGHACFMGSSDWASVDARDRYRVVGPAGGAMAFTARVHAQGSAGGFGSVGVALSETGGGTTSVNEGMVGGFNQFLVLPLMHAPGEEFVLEIYSYASPETSAQATAELSFTGLPAGYGVASCQGFNGSGAVPALPVSWGALKVRYR